MTTGALPGGAGGVLIWPVKTAFLQYLARTADGRPTLDPPATQSEAGFLFPSASAELQFHGGVVFTGHHGQLNIAIRDPALELDLTTSVAGSQAQAGVLTISDPDWAGRRMQLARFELHPYTTATGAAGERGTQVRLTADGADLFLRVYQEGEALDDFVVEHPRRPVTTATAGTTGTTGSTS
jgi:hypothetical protein